MSDRHIRRDGSDYSEAFLTLLPQGQAWPKHAPDSVLVQTVTGLCDYWGFVDARAADLLEQESDPRYTIELLPDWERNWGLPDPCYTAPLTLAERQLALVMRMTMQGSQSREFFIDVAARIGYSIRITEYRVWVVGLDRCGDSRVYGDGSNPMLNEWGQPILNTRSEPVVEGELSAWPHYGLGPPSNRFYWTVSVDRVKLIWFRCSSGQCGVDPHLRIGLADDLECLLNRLKPAHTQIIFDYATLNQTKLYPDIFINSNTFFIPINVYLKLSPSLFNNVNTFYSFTTTRWLFPATFSNVSIFYSATVAIQVSPLPTMWIGDDVVHVTSGPTTVLVSGGNS